MRGVDLLLLDDDGADRAGRFACAAHDALVFLGYDDLVTVKLVYAHGACVDACLADVACLAVQNHFRHFFNHPCGIL